MVHVGPDTLEGFAGWLYDIPHGRASILFVFLAGLSMALAGRASGDGFYVRFRLAWVAAFFLPLGLLLQMPDHGIAVILHYYAVYYLLGVLVVGLNTRMIGLIALAWTLAGPVLYFALYRYFPGIDGGGSVDAGDGLSTILSGLFLTGHYPLITWAPALLWGLWLGRSQRMKHPALLVMAGSALIGGAAAVSAIARVWAGDSVDGTDWARLFSDEAHSQMLPWIAGAIGSAIALLGALIWVEGRWPALLRPLLPLGQMALSFYVLHLLVLAVWGDQLRHESVALAFLITLGFAGVFSLFALAWRRFFPRGPVEWLVTPPFDR